MTLELTNAIEEALRPKGVMVIVEARHTCMMVGGRYDYGMPAHTDSITKTSDVRGVFLLFSAPRSEALQLIYGGN
jgi:GTP cyclohydrolase I